MAGSGDCRNLAVAATTLEGEKGPRMLTKTTSETLQVMASSSRELVPLTIHAEASEAPCTPAKHDDMVQQKGKGQTGKERKTCSAPGEKDI